MFLNSASLNPLSCVNVCILPVLFLTICYLFVILILFVRYSLSPSVFHLQSPSAILESLVSSSGVCFALKAASVSYNQLDVFAWDELLLHRMTLRNLA